MPSEGWVGGRPTPRNDSVASVMIARAKLIVAITSTGAMTFGRMWRTTMRRRRCRSAARPARSPCASRPSSSRAPCARTAPRTTARWRRSGRRRPSARACCALSSAARRRRSAARREWPGKVSWTSATRMITASTRAARIAGEQAERDAERRRERDRRAAPISSDTRARRGWPRGCRGPGCRCRAGSAGRRRRPDAAASWRSIRFTLAGSNGLCGAIQGASRARQDEDAASPAPATTVTFEREEARERGRCPAKRGRAASRRAASATGRAGRLVHALSRPDIGRAAADRPRRRAGRRRG